MAGIMGISQGSLGQSQSIFGHSTTSVTGALDSYNPEIASAVEDLMAMFQLTESSEVTEEVLEKLAGLIQQFLGALPNEFTEANGDYSGQNLDALKSALSGHTEALLDFLKEARKGTEEAMEEITQILGSSNGLDTPEELEQIFVLLSKYGLKIDISVLDNISKAINDYAIAMQQSSSSVDDKLSELEEILEKAQQLPVAISIGAVQETLYKIQDEVYGNTDLDIQHDQAQAISGISEHGSQTETKHQYRPQGEGAFGQMQTDSIQGQNAEHLANEAAAGQGVDPRFSGRIIPVTINPALMQTQTNYHIDAVKKVDGASSEMQDMMKAYFEELLPLLTDLALFATESSMNNFEDIGQSLDSGGSSFGVAAG